MLAIVGTAVLLASCATPGEKGPGPASPTGQTASYPLAPTQLVGRTFAEADAVLRTATISTSAFGKPFRGPEAYRRTAQGTITPIASTSAGALTVVAATFTGSSASPMDDVRVGLLVDDKDVAPKPGSTEYRGLTDGLVEAMKLSPHETTTVTQLWVQGGENIEDVFWRFVDRAVRSTPLTRGTTTALVGRELQPLAPFGSGRYGAPDAQTWADGVRLDGVVVTEAPATSSWVHTGFDIAPRSQVCGVDIENSLRSRYPVTPSKADDIHSGRPTPHRATVAGGVIDFYLTTDCVTSVTIGPRIQ
ncbi:hypothetical protein AXK57_03170 [Tsukamurella pulmonis]|uniref:hypothetical protein n=1 Tax=Tsukamurella pulmonis TaxID=47312 RepID=UPI00079B388A|nr:hypothetical protein [Tsukamurella pulmonis]KXP13238.1 hypothetical protein AXK57_03170 [Tsukamurella pulmonis]RDH12976.1 hypothetical protein DVB88_04780 [Tsukamurella pulmonis]